MLVLGLSLSGYAESYDDKLAVTDRSSPDSLYELVLWCRENGFHSSANQHIREILALDPNHAPTRELQGFVWDGRRWVHRSRMAGAGQGDNGSQGNGTNTRPAGPPPKASEIDWDLTVPANPDTENVVSGFLRGEIEAMNRGNTALWATLMVDGQRAAGISLLKQAIVEGRYTDLQVPIQLARAKVDEGNMSAARRMLPFMVKASEKNTKVDDLALFAYHAGTFGDKRIIPRLIELLDHPDEDVQFNTRYSLGQFMHRGVDDVSKQDAIDWWARFHNAPDSVIYAESLRHRDPGIRLSAVQSITRADWIDDVMPVLIALVRENERHIFLGAADQLRRVTGSSWDIGPNSSPDQRQAIAKRLEDWWKDNRGRFRPVYIRQQTANEAAAAPDAPRDRIAEWVQQLGDLDSSVASNATNQLRSRGDEAIPALITRGLGSADGITRNRARDILRELSGQNFGFEGIRGSDQDRQDALELWRTWAMDNGHLERD